MHGAPVSFPTLRRPRQAAPGAGAVVGGRHALRLRRGTHDLAYQVRPAACDRGARRARSRIWSVVMTYRASPRDGAAWVTGASSGIGRGVALELARRGYVVVASARRAEELQTLVREAQGLGGRIEPAPLDVTDRDATAKSLRRSRPGNRSRSRSSTRELFRRTARRFRRPRVSPGLRTNVFGVANGLNPLMKAMRKRGRGQIAINGSLVGRGFFRARGAYGASKAAVINLAASAKFVGDRAGLTVQIVNPGFVRTPLTADSYASDARDHLGRRRRPGASATVSSAADSKSLFRGGSPGSSKRLNLLPYQIVFRAGGQGAQSADSQPRRLALNPWSPRKPRAPCCARIDGRRSAADRFRRASRRRFAAYRPRQPGRVDGRGRRSRRVREPSAGRNRPPGRTSAPAAPD